MSDIVGVFDDVNGSDETSRVKYNKGATPDSNGEDVFVHAVVTHVVDEKNLVLATWETGVFTLINDGKPVPERAVADYEGQSGGVTWTR